MTPNSANIIQGNLPFQAPGNPLAGAQGGLGGLADQYANSYNSALKQNQQLYSNILQGYQQTAQQQTGAQDAIARGYSDLYGNVLGSIKGIGASQSQAIADTYAQQSGGLAQQMTNAGLGNTTVAAQMQRGPQLDAQKAQIALANQMAQLTAGYQSNLGMAGLNQANSANMQNTALAGQQLGFMNSVTAQYPNAQDYYGLYSQQGQWQQAQADRDLAMKLAQMGQTHVAAPQGVGSGSAGAGGWGSDMQPPIGSRGVAPSYEPSPVLGSGSNGVTGPGGYQPQWGTPIGSQPGGYLAAQNAQINQNFGMDFAGSPGANYDWQPQPQFGGSNVSNGYEYSVDPYADPYAYGDIGGQGGEDPYAWW